MELNRGSSMRGEDYSPTITLIHSHFFPKDSMKRKNFHCVSSVKMKCPIDFFGFLQGGNCGSVEEVAVI